MAGIKSICIDLETYSEVDLQKCGVYKYAESESFEILLFGYSVDDDEVQVVDLAMGEQIPEVILRALTDNSIIKHSWNAAFERVCLSYWLRRHHPEFFSTYCSEEDPAHYFIDPKGWRCDAVLSSYNGLPRSLEGAGAVLRLSEQKLKEGKDLIKYFCCPCAPTKVNGGRTRNLPEHAPEKWDLFKKYNKRDVEVEATIKKRLEKYPVPGFVWDEYHLDQQINDRGVALDMDLVENAIKFDDRSRNELMISMQNLTGLDNPNSVQQLRQWLSDNGMELDSLGKKEVAASMADAPEEIQKVLALRLQIAKSSIKKYQAMSDVVSADGRARGTFVFYGASRTGRWSGSKIQLQNLVQNHMPDLEEARELVRIGDFETMELLYDSVPSALSELIRTALVPRPGYKFIVSDFSAIEARVIAWLAGEQWRKDVFKNNGDIYCASASQMFKVPVVKHGINGHLRQKGKIAELALGYGGSVGALTQMGALEMGIPEEELQPLVDSWRTSNPNIVRFWWDVDSCVKQTINERITTETNGIRFEYRSGMLFIHLPSGRSLAYVKPQIGENKFGGESVTYEGVGTAKKWERLESYGPKFVENIVQAISRDILCYTMQNLKDRFIVGHVHDELIIECLEGTRLEDICEIMGKTPPWAPGLLLRADGYETHFYKKD